MKILVIGGTQFLGRFFVKQALEKGHDVTLFNRGRTNPGLFKQAKTIIGDRKNDLGKLEGQTFDAVVDPSGYFPQNLKEVTNFLKPRAKQYLFVSSCSVYDHERCDINALGEDAPLVDLQIDPSDEGMETYGARKYLCENEVRSAFPGSHLIVRPGLIVGPFDNTYRFSYWGDRFSEGGEILAPGDPDAPLQFIDVRDLASWMLHGVENRLSGTFNATSPHGQITMGQFLNLAMNTIDPTAQLTWVSEPFLREQNVACWSQLPLWVYQEIQGFLKVDSAQAVARGLKFRPVVETIRDTQLWSKDVYRQWFLDKVLSRKREQELLILYKQSK